MWNKYNYFTEKAGDFLWNMKDDLSCSSKDPNVCKVI